MSYRSSFVCKYGALTPDELALAQANFVAYDVDCDGVISRSDFHTAMIKHDSSWALKAKELDTMYAGVDVSILP